MNSSNIFTIPNFLSFFRLLVSPFFLFLVKTDINLAFFLFILVSITDAFDGLIARLTNSVSFLGKLLDPIADKVLTLSLSFAFIKLKYHMPTILFKLILAREMFIILGGVLLLYFGVVPKPSYLGKLATFSMLVLFCGLFIENIKGCEIRFINLLYDVVGVFVVLSFLEYLNIGVRNIISVLNHKVLK
ncbi:MAG: CDP-alcohol phosphatidyltransferase family protein [Hydrogenobaculum sp.]